MADPDNLAVLVRALEVAVTGDVADLDQIFTDDVVGWSPNLSITTRDELADAIDDREDALSQAEIAVTASQLGPDRAVAEWTLAAVHTDPLVLDDDAKVDPSNQRIVLAGATFAEFRDGRISGFRHYFDDAALLEQLLLPG
jgi:ketosteroid isomerase-like protein